MNKTFATIGVLGALGLGVAVTLAQAPPAGARPGPAGAHGAARQGAGAE